MHYESTRLGVNMAIVNIWTFIQILSSKFFEIYITNFF